MSRPEGLKKTGGRKAGTPNQKSAVLQERIAHLLGGDDLPGAIFSRLKKLPIDRQIEVLLGLMPYVYPKRKATEVNLDKGFTFADFMMLAEEEQEVV